MSKIRLTAVYLPENSLPHVFGENHKGQTLNFGGTNKYIIYSTDQNILVINSTKNEGLIEGFYGEKITNITAIVGKNGIGKTSILRAINHSFDSKNINALYIFEDIAQNKIYIKNELGSFPISSDMNYEIFDFSKIDRSKLYYTPVLDFELLQTKTPLKLSESSNDSLYPIYLNQVTKSLFLLTDPIIEDIKKVYDDFPAYENLSIKVSFQKKSYFQDIYARANLGNKERADVVRIYIEEDIKKIKDGKEDTLSKNYVLKLLEHYDDLIKSKSFNSLFDEIWDMNDYKTEESNEFFHHGQNFLADFEITIISYLLLGGIFPSTPFQGSYDFSNIISASNFDDRLNELLALFIANCNKFAFEKLQNQLGKIDVADFDIILKITNGLQQGYTSQGFKEDDSLDLLNKHLHTFKIVKDFYVYLKSVIDDNKFTFTKEELLFNFKKHNFSSFLEFMQKYNLLLETLESLPTNVVIFDFKPEKVLSSGEKSLLNFFATIFDYIKYVNENDYQKLDFYILLLDEPELGYHPLWKKKFIQAVTKILPILFEKIKIKNNDNLNIPITTPYLQIIFTTHDPLTLSAIPSSNTIYLEYDSEIKRGKIVDYHKKSFGANISDLFADSFFLNDGIIGDFAKEKIQTTINWILDCREQKKNIGSDFIIPEQEYQHHRNLIAMIDENVLRIKLAEMLEELADENILQAELLTREINYLTRKRDDLSRPK